MLLLPALLQWHQRRQRRRTAIVTRDAAVIMMMMVVVGVLDYGCCCCCLATGVVAVCSSGTRTARYGSSHHLGRLLPASAAAAAAASGFLSATTRVHGTSSSRRRPLVAMGAEALQVRRTRRTVALLWRGGSAVLCCPLSHPFPPHALLAASLLSLPSRHGIGWPIGWCQRRGPSTPAPVYDDSKAGLVDKALYRFFRRKVVEQLGEDVEDQGFTGLMELVRRLNNAYPDKRGAQGASRRILLSLFPAWLPPAFKVMFAKPLPGISAKMNAWITQLTTYWLMGPSELVDVEVDGGRVAKGQGLQLERCRYLEEARWAGREGGRVCCLAHRCASVCVNTCKVPTEAFFMHDMGIPLTMTPNHDDFSCEFAFGRTPPPQSQDKSFQVDCFAQCPTAGKRKTGEPLCYQIEIRDDDGGGGGSSRTASTKDNQ